MPSLQPDEISRYQRDGWVMPQWRLPEARVDTMRAALDELTRILGIGSVYEFQR